MFIHKNGMDYILLKLIVERSSFFPSELTTEIKEDNGKLRCTSA
jgi:hypothetical protein